MARCAKLVYFTRRRAPTLQSLRINTAPVTSAAFCDMTRTGSKRSRAWHAITTSSFRTQATLVLPRRAFVHRIAAGEPRLDRSALIARVQSFTEGQSEAFTRSLRAATEQIGVDVLTGANLKEIAAGVYAFPTFSSDVPSLV